MHLDDASVKVIGSDFSQVLAKCIKGHMQPLQLFYANPEFETMFGDDERYRTGSGTMSHTSSSSRLSGQCSTSSSSAADLSYLGGEKRAAFRDTTAGGCHGKPAPPRPPLRTVSRVTPPYHAPHQQQQPYRTSGFTLGDRVAASSSITTGPAVLDTLHMSRDAIGEW